MRGTRIYPQSTSAALSRYRRPSSRSRQSDSAGGSLLPTNSVGRPQALGAIWALPLICDTTGREILAELMNEAIRLLEEEQAVTDAAALRLGPTEALAEYLPDLE